MKSSLGFTQQSGWADEESQQKYDSVLTDYATRMEGKDPSESIAELFGATSDYDADMSVKNTVKDIPQNSTFTTVGSAKKAADKAIAAGARPEDIKEDLKAKNWDDSDIKKILSGAAGSMSSNPLAL